MQGSVMPWFIWKGENSYANGLWINKLPKIVRANERRTEITVPGRAGSLIILEDEDVYDSYVKECTVMTANPPNMEHLLNWLRGSGDLIFCNEIEYVYKARIAAQVEFQRVSNDLLQARIPFLVEPFKAARYPKKITQTVQANESFSIQNTGNVASKPVVNLTRNGNITVTIAGQAMTFAHVRSTITIDCDAQVITKIAQRYNASTYYWAGEYVIKDDGGVDKIYRVTETGTGTALEVVGVWDGNDYVYIWTGEYEGDFWKIPPGTSTVTSTGAATIEIEPNWRWV